MIELLTGSLGEGQPEFKVIVGAPVSLDQAEQIAMLLKQSIDEARSRLDSLMSDDTCEECHLEDGFHIDDCSNCSESPSE